MSGEVVLVNFQYLQVLTTHLKAMFYFCTPRKHQKGKYDVFRGCRDERLARNGFMLCFLYVFVIEHCLSQEF